MVEVKPQVRTYERVSSEQVIYEIEDIRPPYEKEGEGKMSCFVVLVSGDNSSQAGFTVRYEEVPDGFWIDRGGFVASVGRVKAGEGVWDFKAKIIPRPIKWLR